MPNERKEECRRLTSEYLVLETSLLQVGKLNKRFDVDSFGACTLSGS